jgi:hypothetical protein
MPKRVLMLLSNPFLPDPRVEKEATALIDAGFHVKILAWDRGKKKPQVTKEKGIDDQRIWTNSTSRGYSFPN